MLFILKFQEQKREKRYKAALEVLFFIALESAPKLWHFEFVISIKNNSEKYVSAFIGPVGNYK